MSAYINRPTTKTSGQLFYEKKNQCTEPHLKHLS